MTQANLQLKWLSRCFVGRVTNRHCW